MVMKIKKKHLILITLLIVVIVSGVILFMVFEPPFGRRPGGPRNPFKKMLEENVLPGLMETAAARGVPGEYPSGNHLIRILSDTEAVALTEQERESGEPNFDHRSDSMYFVRKIKTQAGKEIYCKLFIRPELKPPVMAFFFNIRFAILVIVSFLGALVILLTFSSHKNYLSAESENQKYTAMKRMARALAHEIRNPLNALHLSLEIVKNDGDSVAPEKRADFVKCIGIMDSEIKRLDGLVERFMEYSKGVSPALADHDLAECVRGVVQVMSPIAIEKGVAVAEERVEAVNAKFDRDLIYQSVLNILKNAIEASPANGNVRYSVYARKGRAFVEVRDDGPGISPENAEKLFNFYFSTKAEGAGIGLAISRKFAEAHGGAVEYARENGLTLFTLSFPVKGA